MKFRKLKITHLVGFSADRALKMKGLALLVGQSGRFGRTFWFAGLNSNSLLLILVEKSTNQSFGGVLLVVCDQTVVILQECTKTICEWTRLGIVWFS